VKAELPVDVTFEHIYRHQDKLLWYDDLPQLVQLNVQMDRKAKAKVHHIESLGMDLADCQEIQGDEWSVWVCRVKLMADPGPGIRQHIFGEGLRAKLDNTGRIPVDVFWDVNWDAIGEVTAKTPQLFKLWMSKHASGCFGIGKNMKQWGFWDHNTCPCCQSATEDKAHLVMCLNQYCKDVWQSNIMIVEEWMEQEDMLPEICGCLIRALRERSMTWDFRTDCNAQVIGVAEIQMKIGWMNFMEGKLASQWQELQKGHYERICSDKSVKKWARGLVMELLQLMHSQWVYRNSIKHKKNRRGLNIEDTPALDHAIDSQSP